MGIPCLPRRPGDGAQAAGREGTSSGRPRPHSGRAPGPGQGACSGRSILPHLGRTKGEEKGSKRPSVCQSLTHPRARRLALGSRKRQALLREPELRPAGRTGGQGRGRARRSRGRGRRLTKRPCAAPVAGRSGAQDPGLGTRARRPSTPGATPRAHCLSTLSHASSVLLAVS